MNRVPHFFLLLLAFVAVGHLQVFGAQRSYLCLHAGLLQEMTATHCHDERSEAKTATPSSAERLPTFTPCESEAVLDECAEQETAYHAALSIQLESDASTLAGAMKPPAFIPAFLADLPPFAWLVELVGASASAASSPPPSSGAPFHPLEHGSASLVVAHCIVLLV